jgi:hypothetical protein
MRKAVVPLVITLLAAFFPASCRRAPEGYAEALQNFDDFVGADCPQESLRAVARKMGARSEEVRVVHYGPTGRPDSTHYFAALSRKGKVLVGVVDEAWAKITRVDYENEFDRDGFIWAVKSIRNDRPFGDRRVRYGWPLPVKIEYGARDVALEFVDGWVPSSQKWSTGKVRVNLAGTALLDEDHGLDFALSEGERRLK